MELYYVTNNDLKFQIAKKILDVNLKQIKLDIPEIKSVNIEEIAIKKAKDAYEKLKKTLIVNVSSFLVKNLNNFSNTYLQAEEILKSMTRLQDKTCYYLDVIVYINEYEIKVFVEKTKSEITKINAKGPYYYYDEILIKERKQKPICFFNKNISENLCYYKLNKYLKKRKVARGIIFFADKVLLLYRNRLDEHKKMLKYYAIPGGGVEKNETIEEACIREVFEEVSLKVKIKKYLGYEEYEKGICYYYLTEYLSGDIKLGGEELKNNNSNNFYEPRLISISKLDTLTIPGGGVEVIKKAYQYFHN